MTFKRLEIPLLILLAIGGIFLWCRLSLPRYQSIDLSVNQPQAIDIAKHFMQDKQKIDVKSYKVAVMFNVDEGTDRYLQKTLSNADYRALMQKYHYDLFCWIIRFFKEKQKEEFKIAISSASGQVIAFTHLIEDTASRPSVDKEKARQFAFNYLKASYGFDPNEFVVHAENSNKYDNRLEYAFSWQDKRVEIPWGQSNEKGFAKLLTSVVISGNDILSFNKYQFEIPDGFNRYVDNLKQTGENLTLVFRLFYLALITIAIMLVVNRKQQVVLRSVKKFYVGIGIALFVLMILDVLNGYQDIIYSYPTTQSLGDYIVRQFVESVIGPFFIAIGLILPALAGESLRFEVSPQDKHQGFLTTILSSFCSVSVARQIFIGYIAASIILGAQAVIFKIGFKYWGVWDELSWVTQASTSLIPAFSALLIGFHASFSEEAMFRLFAINLFKRYGLPTLLAVFLAAMMWGFGHTGYEIFPMWFRGVEVTCVGMIMGFFYLRFGLVCVIAAHFLIDSFLSSLPYLLNPHRSFDLYSSLFVIALPLFLGVVAFIFNKNAQEKPLRVRFNPQQEFNYGLLKELSRSKTPDELVLLKKNLERHGWDAAIIQRVFEEKD